MMKSPFLLLGIISGLRGFHGKGIFLIYRIFKYSAGIFFGLAIGFSFSLPSFAATADHLVISQVQITGGPGKTTNDFVEIYNPTDLDIDLKGMRLVKRTKTGTADTSLKSWTAETIVKAHGFYLWANSDFADIGATPDVTTSGSIANDNGVAIRNGPNDTGTIVDSVAWGEAANIFVEDAVFASIPESNQSLERKPGGSAGNGEDANNNSQDFFLQSASHPRNSQSPIQPPIENPAPPPAPPPSPSPEPSPEPSPTPSPPPLPSPEPTPPPPDPEPDPVPPPPPTPTPPPPPVFNLEFSEILPNPNGNDSGNEWVELYNPGPASFDLSGWYLDDYDAANPPGSSAIILGSGTIIESQKYSAILISAGKFSLNNARSDGVKLFDKDKAMKLMQSYPDIAKDGFSYAKDSAGQWKWTDILTPGEKNKFPEQTFVEKQTEKVKEKVAEVKSNLDNAQDKLEQKIEEVKTAIPSTTAFTTGDVGSQIAGVSISSKQRNPEKKPYFLLALAVFCGVGLVFVGRFLIKKRKNLPKDEKKPIITA